MSGSRRQDPDGTRTLNMASANFCVDGQSGRSQGIVRLHKQRGAELGKRRSIEMTLLPGKLQLGNFYPRKEKRSGTPQRRLHNSTSGPKVKIHSQIPGTGAQRSYGLGRETRASSSGSFH